MENDIKVIRRYYRFFGRVQGVGFRFRARHYATGYGLTGWVKNCYDGSVEMEVQGPVGMINRLITSIRESAYIGIDDFTCKEIELCTGEYGFHTR